MTEFFIALGVGLPLVLLALWGKTDDLAPLDEDELRELASIVCEGIGDEPQTVEVMSQLIAETRHPQLTWPPPMLNATASHRVWWETLQAWLETLVEGAADVGETPCELLADMMPPLPPPPVVTFTGQSGGGGGGGTETTPGPATLDDIAPGDGGGDGWPVLDEPTPGYAYQIEGGDTLSGVSTKAYGTTGFANVAGQKAINDDPWNRANAGYQATKPGESYLGATRIDFLPPFDIIRIPVL